MSRASDLELLERYESGCKVYDELYGEEQLEKYVSGLRLLPPHGRVVDVGCGTGLLVEFMAKTGLLSSVDLYVCVDISQCMARKAALRTMSLCSDKCLVVIADVYSLPFKDAEFDIAYSFSLINLLEDPVKALEEVGRVARKALATAVGSLGSFARLPKGWSSVGHVGKDHAYLHF